MLKYTNKKRRLQPVLELIRSYVSGKVYQRMLDCHDWVNAYWDEGNTRFKAVETESCTNRFCPICAMVKANKAAKMLSCMMDYLEAEKGMKFVYLTLTAPNVTGPELDSEIKRFNDAFKKMFQRKAVKEMHYGYVRKLEVTYNAEKKITKDMWDGTGRYKSKPHKAYFTKRGLYVGDPNPSYDTYHTHFSVLIAVDKKYFYGGRYRDHGRWLDLWREAMDDESIMNVDIRGTYKMPGKPGGAVRELAKYSAKDEDYTGVQVVQEEGGYSWRAKKKAAEVFDRFYFALKSKQLLTYSRCFAAAKKLYEKGELDKYKQKGSTKYKWHVVHVWKNWDYVESKRRELSDLEKAGLVGDDYESFLDKFDSDEFFGREPLEDCFDGGDLAELADNLAEADSEAEPDPDVADEPPPEFDQQKIDGTVAHPDELLRKRKTDDSRRMTWRDWN